MHRRALMAFLVFEAATLAAPAFSQPANTADLAKFLPGKWTNEDGKAGVDLTSVKDGAVTGRWLDITGTTYPIGATWSQNKAASGRFENGVLHLVLPTGNKLELNLSPDGSTLSGTRQVVAGGSFNPGQKEVTFKRR
jgi:hypothetical protein